MYSSSQVQSGLSKFGSSGLGRISNSTNINSSNTGHRVSQSSTVPQKPTLVLNSTASNTMSTSTGGSGGNSPTQSNSTSPSGTPPTQTATIAATSTSNPSPTKPKMTLKLNVNKPPATASSTPSLQQPNPQTTTVNDNQQQPLQTSTNEPVENQQKDSEDYSISDNLSIETFQDVNEIDETTKNTNNSIIIIEKKPVSNNDTTNIQEQEPTPQQQTAQQKPIQPTQQQNTNDNVQLPTSQPVQQQPAQSNQSSQQQNTNDNLPLPTPHQQPVQPIIQSMDIDIVKHENGELKEKFNVLQQNFQQMMATVAQQQKQIEQQQQQIIDSSKQQQTLALPLPQDTTPVNHQPQPQKPQKTGLQAFLNNCNKQSSSHMVQGYRPNLTVVPVNSVSSKAQNKEKRVLPVSNTNSGESPQKKLKVDSNAAKGALVSCNSFDSVESIDSSPPSEASDLSKQQTILITTTGNGGHGSTLSLTGDSVDYKQQCAILKQRLNTIKKAFNGEFDKQKLQSQSLKEDLSTLIKNEFANLQKSSSTVSNASSTAVSNNNNGQSKDVQQYQAQISQLTQEKQKLVTEMETNSKKYAEHVKEMESKMNVDKESMKKMEEDNDRLTKEVQSLNEQSTVFKGSIEIYIQKEREDHEKEIEGVAKRMVYLSKKVENMMKREKKLTEELMIWKTVAKKASQADHSIDQIVRETESQYPEQLLFEDDDELLLVQDESQTPLVNDSTTQMDITPSGQIKWGNTGVTGGDLAHLIQTQQQTQQQTQKQTQQQPHNN